MSRTVSWPSRFRDPSMFSGRTCGEQIWRTRSQMTGVTSRGSHRESSVFTHLLQRDGLDPLHVVDVKHVNGVLAVHRQVGGVVTWWREGQMSFGEDLQEMKAPAWFHLLQRSTHRRWWGRQATSAPAAATADPASPRRHRWHWSRAAAPCWRSPRRTAHPGSAAGWRSACGPLGAAGSLGTCRHGRCMWSRETKGGRQHRGLPRSKVKVNYALPCIRNIPALIPTFQFYWLLTNYFLKWLNFMYFILFLLLYGVVICFKLIDVDYNRMV